MKKLLLVLLLSCATQMFADTTVVYDEKVSKVAGPAAGETDLWLTMPDLTRVSGFVVKPQGACLGELCVPLPKAREKAFLRGSGAAKHFNLSELARTLHQPEVFDAELSIHLFGARPEIAGKYQETLEAPDFTLTDWKGQSRSLHEFRGKKVLLLTWASW